MRLLVIRYSVRQPRFDRSGRLRSALGIEALEDRCLPSGSATLLQDVPFVTGVTNWARTASAAQFDPALGTLTAVEIANRATFTSRIRVESLDFSPTQVAARTGGRLTVSGPGVAALAATPAVEEVFQAAAFDGAIDFDGGSGHDFGSLSAADTAAVTLTALSDLDLFVGSGSVSFQAAALADSHVAGAGNFVSHVATTAGAEVRIVYRYTPAPDPPFDVGRQTSLPSQTVPDRADPVEPTSPSSGLEPPNGVPPFTSSLLVAALLGSPLSGFLSLDAADSPARPIFRGTVDFIVTDRLASPGGLSGGSDSEEAGDGLASLSGYVFRDDDDNGRVDPREPGIGGVALVLTGVTERGRAVVRMTATDDLGFYTFDELPPGKYMVTETQPRRFLDGKRQVGTVNGQFVGKLLADDAIADIRLPPLGVGVNYNFGELPAVPDSEASENWGPFLQGALAGLFGWHAGQRAAPRTTGKRESDRRTTSLTTFG